MRQPPDSGRAEAAHLGPSNEFAAATTAAGPSTLTVPPAAYEPDALDVAQALDVAHDLIAAGVPVFAARPDVQDGVWQPKGGHGASGYWLPPSWQQTVPTTNWLDPTVPGYEGKAWRPGWALAAVMGHGLDLLDIDPRNGGDASRAALVAAGQWPTVYAVADTPSGGTHEFVASLGVASLDNLMPGLDVKAGRPDGKGRGFAFIAPTVKAHKVTGALVAYRWQVRP